MLPLIIVMVHMCVPKLLIEWRAIMVIIDLTPLLKVMAPIYDGAVLGLATTRYL